MMLDATISAGHEHGAAWAAVADGQTKNVAVKRDGALDVAHVEPQMSERCDFRHKVSRDVTEHLSNGVDNFRSYKPRSTQGGYGAILYGRVFA
jgi:hypothetical protein